MIVGVLIGLAMIALGAVAVRNRQGLYEFFQPYHQRWGSPLAKRGKANDYLWPAIGMMIVGALLVILFLVLGH